MITFLINVFPGMFFPTQYLALYKIMIAFTGRTIMKQYMPLKPIKCGFKVLMLDCSVNW